jgi:hypothetical protein
MSKSDVHPLLLKGPTTAGWLYAAGDRPYTDIDILVAPDMVTTASSVLRALGFDTSAPPLLSQELGSSGEWTRDSDGMAVDLHTSITGLEQIAERAWDVLKDRSTSFRLLDTYVGALDKPARLLTLCLHAIFRVPTEDQPLRDLEMAIQHVDIDTWKESAELGRELGVLETFSLGLHQTVTGEAFADQLGLPAGVEPLSIRISKEHGSPTANLVMQMRSLRTMTLRDRSKLIARKIVPSVAYMRTASNLGARGGPFLALAYIVRPLWLLWVAVRSIPVMFRHRSDDSIG